MKARDSKIHPTAVVHSGAEIDSTCEIGPYCIIGPKVKMGPNNILQSHVVIEETTTIGADNIFYPFSVIGGRPQDLKYRGEETKLEIGNKNTFRECVTINTGTVGGGWITKVGNNNLLMAYVHLGHDVILENNTVIANSCQIAGHVLIQDWAILGGMTAVSQFVRVGAHSYVGGCSGVDRDMPPFALGRGPTGQFEILGMNLVGLKRRGFKDEEISLLQDINKLFFRDKSLEKEAALQRLENKYPEETLVKQFVGFIRGSDKGTYR